MQVVLIPCWRRPEMLAVTLERLAAAKGAERNHYIFAVDNGYDDEVLDVIRQFPLTSEFRQYDRERVNNGNAQNILSGLHRAVQVATFCGASVVYLIEDDIWVAPDFFEFHELAHKTFNPAVVSACKNQKQTRKFGSSSDQVYYDDHYQSLGVSFSVEMAAKIAKHDTPLYYTDPEKYLLAAFPSSKVPSYLWDSDGLIARVIEGHGRKVLYAVSPRAFHAGFYGLNRRGYALQGTLEEKISGLKSMTELGMNNMTQTKDISFCDPNGFFDTSLELMGDGE